MGTAASMSENTDASRSESDATFLGWQETGSGDAFALYVVTAANHPSRGSTVSQKGLHKLDLQVPGVPPRQGIAFGRNHDRAKGRNR